MKRRQHRELKTSFLNRNVGLFSIALITFCSTILAFAPATLLIPAIKRTVPQLAFTNVEGTVWDAQIRHLTVENIPIGDVRFVFNFSSLLQGNFAYTILVDGNALRGTLKTYRHLSGKIEVRSETFEIGRTVMSRMALLGVPLNGNLTFSDATIVLKNNQCTQSDGYVETNLLNAPAEQFGVTAPNLSGSIICKDGRLGIELAGSEDSFGDVSLNFTSHPPSHLILRAELSLIDQALASALKYSGFEENGNAIEFEQIVPL